MEFFTFLAEPWFVVPWYVVGIIGAIWVAFDLARVNTPLKKAMKWAWPIIVAFFSVIGLALYVWTARAPGIGKMQSDEEKMKAHHAYEENMFRRVNGAVIHCVAGDGLGIMTAMVIARLLNFTFWLEFWFEYLVGFLFGWFIFQFKSMTMMTDDKGKALAMAFRAEFFSMLTVMSGMGAVMTFVTPLAVGAQPKPDTAAFWGFGMLGLIVGYVLTFPMNWMMVKVGWKHGMGSMEGAHEAEHKQPLLWAMVVLGALALILPAWLTEVREGRPVAPSVAATSVEDGVRASLEAADRNLAADERAEATNALDAALRTAEVSGEQQVIDRVKRARHALWNRNDEEARAQIGVAVSLLAPARATTPTNVGRYKGVRVLDAKGVEIGEVARVEGNQLELALHGIRDLWGFLDLTRGEHTVVAADDVAFGPKRATGKSYAALRQ